MATLHTILSEEFGYSSSDFGSADGAVWVDSKRGTMRPSARTDSGPEMTVPISAILKDGDEITMVPHRGSDNKIRFTIISTNEDGFSVLFANGSTGFLPWEVLSYGISNPSTVDINNYGRQRTGGLTGDADLSEAEIRHLNQRLQQCYLETHTILTRIDILTKKLQEPSLDRPSSWLAET